MSLGAESSTPLPAHSGSVCPSAEAEHQARPSSPFGPGLHEPSSVRAISRDVFKLGVHQIGGGSLLSRGQRDSDTVNRPQAHFAAQGPGRHLTAPLFDGKILFSESTMEPIESK